MITIFIAESETETYVANQGRGSVKGQSEGQAGSI